MDRRPQVGIVCAPGMERTLSTIPDAFDVLEVEPQTLSPALGGHRNAPRPCEADLDTLAPFPHPKVVHSIGLPFGNEVAPTPAEVAGLKFAADAVDSPWVSDHLSFNQAGPGFSGFLLPLAQTPEAVRHCAERISRLADQLQRPMLFETGANYLEPARGSMSDGAFFASVAETADCGILLDLHNLWTNERNGRQAVEAVVGELPLDRVVEVHLAGGFERSGMWIDAHSGLTPDQLLDVARNVLPRLPNLSLVTLEIGVDYFVAADISATRLAEHLDEIRAVLHDPGSVAPHPNEWSRGLVVDERDHPLALTAWRDGLSMVVNGRAVDQHDWSATYSERGVNLYRELVATGRASAIVSAAPLTSRYLLMLYGVAGLEAVVDDFRAATLPHAHPLDELREFESWYTRQPPMHEDIAAVLSFERALLETANDGRARTVTFSTEPLDLLRRLGAGHVPTTAPRRDLRFELTIEPPAAPRRRPTSI